MQTRTFRAKTMGEALRMTRQALGAEALIVSARNVDEAGTVEVTAVGKEPPPMRPPAQFAAGVKSTSTSTVEATADPSAEHWNKQIEPLRDEIASLRRMVRDMQRLTDEAILPGFSDLRNLILETSREQEGARVLGPLYTELVDRGVIPDLARGLIRAVELQLGLSNADQRDWLVQARGLLRAKIAESIEVCGPSVPGDGARTFAFVGPSGVGKTTTLAKVASRMSLSEGMEVAIVTTDTYRIGSVDQARRYAELIGVPFVVADRPETMASALRTYASADALLIDTPGRAFENEEVRRQLRDLLGAAGEPVEVHLLTAATYSPAQQAAIASRFGSLDPTRVLITKIDETLEMGALYNIAKMTGLPVSYLTTGQRVPEDIEVARTARIVQLLSGAAD
ncbi:MAG: flagellar biosynthesis protein FlhF [Myxococcota bacterium]|jgi:flagellar biosynthesis protein FlhF|nr:flagellar biosynthesis protein FlhF [Myxococcota bacterium]